MLNAWIEGIGLLGPGLDGWPQALAVLRGEAGWAHAPAALPAPELLPAAERRRASRIVKATLAAGLQACRQAGRDPASLPGVFASSGGDGHNCHAICELLAGEDRQVSPTRFHNSVHNAAAGYWSIATGATPASQTLSAHDASFAAGLLEAMAQVATGGQPVLLLASDSDHPEPLRACRPVPDASASALARLSLPCRGALAEGVADTVQSVTARTDAALAARLQALSSMAAALPPWLGLPLLAALAAPAAAGRTRPHVQPQAQPVALTYLPPQVLRVEITPLAASPAAP
ncbi:MAG: beta-ketoacyl synthase chain length factor [Ottowia sp.]